MASPLASPTPSMYINHALGQTKLGFSTRNGTSPWLGPTYSLPLADLEDRVALRMALRQRPPADPSQTLAELKRACPRATHCATAFAKKSSRAASTLRAASCERRRSATSTSTVSSTNSFDVRAVHETVCIFTPYPEIA